MRTRVKVGIAGLGYWGPNLARTLSEIPDAELIWLCDTSAEVRLGMQARYPAARCTAYFDDLLQDDELDAVVIATPPATHHELALAALHADKHVLVEKPLALSGVQADELMAEAAARGRRLMAGHVLLFHPAVRKLKQMIDAGALGDLFCIYANRQNLGKVRSDENALWSLGPHDVAVLLYLLEDQPIEVSAHGDCYLQEGVEDVVFGYMKFATGIGAHLHLSWLDPHKLRRLTVVGSRQMAVIDDMETERKLTVYAKSAAPRRTGSFGEYMQVQFGDIMCPHLSNDEPLRLECEHFIGAVRSPGRRLIGGHESAAVVHVLEAMERSMRTGGVPISLDPSGPPVEHQVRPATALTRVR